MLKVFFSVLGVALLAVIVANTGTGFRIGHYKYTYTPITGNTTQYCPDDTFLASEPWDCSQAWVNIAEEGN